MIMLQWCKTQVICFIVLLYISTFLIHKGSVLSRTIQKSNRNSLFKGLFLLAGLAVFFDGITAYTVNYLEQIPVKANLLLHLGLFISYESFTVLLFWYWISATVEIPKRKWLVAAYTFPGMLAVCLTTFFLPKLQFLKGQYTYYSMGISVYICYSCVVIYSVLTITIITAKYRYISRNKRKGLVVTLTVSVAILSLQGIFPEALVSCVAVMLVVISIYLNMENPAIYGMEHYQREMVMGFTTLIENKDDNTGGHIRRSSAYVVLIAENLKKNGKYKALITKDYIDNLAQSAPMHDIGKIGVPDAILQKPEKLTGKEFEKMKEHPALGGKIVKNTFGHLFNGDYENMAFQVARYHHEKWNGGGYPEGLKGLDIPLCARIMAVADVFDAVSAKRCYREALPIKECYKIIQNGRGVDFDPDIVDAFMMDTDKIEKIYYGKDWSMLEQEDGKSKVRSILQRLIYRRKGK